MSLPRRLLAIIVIAGALVASAPSPAGAKVATGCVKTYTVKPNDSWSKIADKVNVTMALLLKVNKSSAKTLLLIGDVICLPRAAVTAAAPKSGLQLSPPAKRYTASQSAAIIKEIFPEFSVFVYGGVNYEPYRSRFEKLIGKKIDSVELFPASEGFFAYQDKQPSEGLLLILDSGIFYEFIPADSFFDENPTRLSLEEVELGVNYALILSNNAGLWAYNIGDTVKFVSKNPYRIVVSGRIKHFTSAFGEHVIAEEVEQALKDASLGENVEIVEFTVAPQVTPESGLPYHEWFVEFNQKPSDPERFRNKIDKALQDRNIYYKDLIKGNVLQPLVIRCLEKDSFVKYMKSQGKLGGQNKVPRLSNDRKIAEVLSDFTTESWGN
jgi:hypothetical protein